MSGQYPFAFRTSHRPPGLPVSASAHTVVVAQPGQEIRVVVPNPGKVPDVLADSRVSPRPPAGRVKPRHHTNGRSRLNGSIASKPGSLGTGTAPEPSYSPRPVTIIAQPGQEIRVIVEDHPTAPPRIMADSRVSPKPPG